MEYLSVVKKDEIMNFAGKWVEFEKIILSEVTQIEKDKCLMFSLIRGSEIQIFTHEHTSRSNWRNMGSKTGPLPGFGSGRGEIEKGGNL